MIPMGFNQTIIILPSSVSCSTILPAFHQFEQFNCLYSCVDSSNCFSLSGDDSQIESAIKLSSLFIPSSQVNSTRCIIDLDDYSLLNIFSYINNIREKIRLKRVCHRFHRLSSESLRCNHQSISKRRDIYYPSEMRPFSRNERRVRLPFDKILVNCPKLVEFKSTACDRICFNVKKLPEHLVSLEKLTLHGWSNVKMSPSIVKRCVNLKFLDLGCIKMSRHFEDHKIDLSMIQSDKLSTLRLHGTHYSLDKLQSFMSLKGFSLRNFHYSSSLTTVSNINSGSGTGMIITPFEPNFFTTLIQIVFNCCPNLNHFELKLVDHDGFGSTIPNLIPLNHLSSMIIKTERRSFNIDLLEIILKHCPSLEYLHIVSSFFNDTDISQLCKTYCPLIKKVTQQAFNWHEL